MKKFEAEILETFLKVVDDATAPVAKWAEEKLKNIKAELDAEKNGGASTGTGDTTGASGGEDTQDSGGSADGTAEGDTSDTQAAGAGEDTGTVETADASSGS